MPDTYCPDCGIDHGTPAPGAAPHRCEFPVLPPWSLMNPGPCECGKTYLASIAEQKASEAGLAVVDPEDLRAVLAVIDDRDALRDDLTPRQDRAATRLLGVVRAAAGVKS